jgi:hypothetical protein
MASDAELLEKAAMLMRKVADGIDSARTSSDIFDELQDEIEELGTMAAEIEVHQAQKPKPHAVNVRAAMLMRKMACDIRAEAGDDETLCELLDGADDLSSMAAEIEAAQWPESGDKIKAGREAGECAEEHQGGAGPGGGCPVCHPINAGPTRSP